MRFIDRVSGRTLEELPEVILFGQWIVDQTTREETTRPIGHQCEEYVVVAPGENEQRVILQGNETIPRHFFSGPLPDEQNVEALSYFGQTLLAPGIAKEGWRKWETVSPIAPKLDEFIKAHPLEEHIKNELKHLEQVCRNPHTHIRVERELLPVSRARRIAPHALIRLASHTEDWEYRRITSVQPHRILAEVREERWDLYENRVAVQLVDNLMRGCAVELLKYGASMMTYLSAWLNLILQHLELTTVM